MKTLHYAGWREDLKGRTALVRQGARAVGRVLVQFDPYTDDREELVYDGLCYGWHDFAADQFEDIRAKA